MQVVFPSIIEHMIIVKIIFIYFLKMITYPSYTNIFLSRDTHGWLVSCWGEINSLLDFLIFMFTNKGLKIPLNVLVSPLLREALVPFWKGKI